MIAGFVEPTSGSTELDGKALDKVPANKRGLGIVFQNYALFPHMTAAENVAFGLEMQKMPKRERDTRVHEALQLVGLKHLADRHPRSEERRGGKECVSPFRLWWSLYL